MLVTQAWAQEEPVAQDQPAEPLNTETGVEPPAGESGFPPFNPETYASQLLWLAITFGLFYLFVRRVLVPQIGGLLENRRDRIAQDLDEAHRLKEEADAAIAAYEQELEQARIKAQEIGAAAREKAKAEAEKKRASAERDLSARVEEAERRIAEIKQRAMGEVGTIAEDTVASIVERLVGAKVTKAEASAAVEAARTR